MVSKSCINTITMGRLIVLLICFIVHSRANFDFENRVWLLMSAIHADEDMIPKCKSDIEINLAHKRLIIHNNTTLCGHSELYSYQHLMNNMTLATEICWQLNFKYGMIEHFGLNYSKVYCVWPNTFFENNSCINAVNANFTSKLQIDVDNCTEAEILAKLDSESQSVTTESVRELFQQSKII
ncbi:unnamed protein product [Thelazia callipaeda]|uniref:DUF3707 domain-containing protein n=1 Tax=Thelazia callipaeda TaxID=103827 RepID=A0A0N5D268_THECL|nr:unnamed protein product [Thelazia callipaeda]